MANPKGKQQKQQNKNSRQSKKGQNPKPSKGYGKQEGYKRGNPNPKKQGSKSNPQDEFAADEFRKGAEAEKELLHKYNDSAWYSKNSTTLKDVASFSYRVALGLPMDFAGLINNATYFSGASSATIPGLYVLKFIPTIGPSSDATSAANIAAQGVFSRVRRNISGNRVYQPTDLMMYYLAMDSVYMCWNWLKRLVGVATTYSQTNRYMPRAYFYANNVDMDDFIANLANFRGFMNTAAASISQFAVPAVFSYNVRHSWMVSNIFKDSDTRKAQQYIFVPAIFYKFDDKTSDQGSSLVPVQVFGGSGLKTSQLMSMMNELIMALQNCDDIGIMAADTITSYGEGNLFTLSAVEDSYTVEPFYSAEVLSQIENTRGMYMSNTDLAASAITQSVDKAVIVYNYKCTQSGNTAQNGMFINMHKEDVSPEDMIVATRLSSAIKEWDATTGAITDATFGSEIVVDERVYYYSSAGEENVTDKANFSNLSLQSMSMQGVVWQFGANGGTNTPSSVLAKQIARIPMINSFDWAPIKYVMEPLGTNSNAVLGATADWDVFAEVSVTDLDQMNKVALMSEFNVPDFGSTF